MASPPSATPSERPQLPEPFLPLLRYRLSFRALEPITLPPLQAALWRGVLGAQVKAADEEAYRYIFETPPPCDAPATRGRLTAPHPYVVAAKPNFTPVTVAPGEGLGFDLTLIGAANAMAPMMIAAIEHAVRGGIGKTRGRAALTQVETVWHFGEPESRPLPPPGAEAAWPAPEMPDIPPMPDAFAEIRLLSPLRLELEGRLVTPDRFGPADLPRSILRRVSSLMLFHAGIELTADFRGLTELARGARIVDASLAFPDQTRWSASQRKELPTGGLIGAFVLDTRGLAPLWPYLWLGQWVHAGKGAAMGMGAYRIFDPMR